VDVLQLLVENAASVVGKDALLRTVGAMPSSVRAASRVRFRCYAARSARRRWSGVRRYDREARFIDFASSADLIEIAVEPAFTGLRSDPRFCDMVQRIGLTASAGVTGS